MTDGIYRERQDSEFREFREFKELREWLSLNSLIYLLNQRDRFLVRRVPSATLGKNPDDGLHFGVLLIVGTLFASGGRCALTTRRDLLSEVVRCGASEK